MQNYEKSTSERADGSLLIQGDAAGLMVHGQALIL